ncbi:MAG: DUF2269 family protein [Gammaproteobacteria bacterium]|nr:DUF2269 family protein [Gammaproteobacteria bacterium]
MGKMFYNYLKIFHILSATLVLTSIVYSYQLWRSMQKSSNSFSFFTRIRKQTATIIIPGALIQLATGFTLMSLQHYPLTDAWVGASISGFILLILSWLGFMYFLSAAQQDRAQHSNTHRRRTHFYRYAQSLMLMLCAFALAIMIFSMATRMTSLHGST